MSSCDSLMIGDWALFAENLCRPLRSEQSEKQYLNKLMV